MPMPTPHANIINNVQIVITTIHSSVIPKMVSSIGAKYHRHNREKKTEKGRERRKFYKKKKKIYIQKVSSACSSEKNMKIYKFFSWGWEINQDIIINFPTHLPHTCFYALYINSAIKIIMVVVMEEDTDKRKVEKKERNLPSHNVPMASSLPSSQWFTLSHNKSGLIQNSFIAQRKSLHVCSTFMFSQ